MYDPKASEYVPNFHSLDRLVEERYFLTDFNILRNMPSPY